MKKIYTLFFMFCILNVTYAGFGKKKKLPASNSANTEKITDSATVTEDVQPAKAINKPETVTVCACQVLMLQSNNEKENNVVLFAEKNITGRLSSNDKRQLKTILEKEKAHMKIFFFNKIKVVAESISTTDCTTSLTILKSSYDNLIIYDILNADVRR